MPRANMHLLFAALLPFAHGVAAAEGSTEFTLNLFTDIAPILALFGEQFAQQYLSQSFTWLDHLIFACIPLGIITALSGAIRTRGPRLARSFIGRARENLATVEIGLMSSVSHEVCEMFNGSGIIRTMGRSTLAQIVIFPDIYDAVRRGESNDASCGIHTLQTASQSWSSTGPLMVRSKYRGKTYQRLRRLLDPEDADKDLINQLREPFDFKCPPNLQLNVSTGQSSRTKKTAELFAASTASVALQLSLLAIAAVVGYHGPTSKAVGYENNRYGFPCYVAGSAFLCAGMAICSAAIESSTDELVWTRSEENIPKAAKDSQSTRNPFILWIQQPQSVGDQAFESYAILGGSKPYILTSSRSRDLWTAGASHRQSGNPNQSKRRWWEAVTMVGVLLGSLGFIVQFIGLRGLPWPVAVSQLLAILIMALVRAIIRRGVGVIPLACAALPGYELDFLATKIVFYAKFREFKCGNPSNWDLADKALSDVCRWKVMTANTERRFTAPANFRPGGPVDNIGQIYVPEDDICSTGDMGSDTLSTEDSDHGYLLNNSSQQLVEVRERLGDLCKWKTSMSEIAVALAQSMEHFLTIFFKEDKWYEILWAIKTSNLGCDANADGEETTLLVQKKHGKWVADLGMVEAVLSLWMATMEAQQLRIKENRDATENLLDPRIGDWRRSGGAKVKFSRIIGDRGSEIFHNSLQCDISWWVAKDLPNEWDDAYDSHYWGERDGSNLLIGFDTPLKGNPEHRDARLWRFIHRSTASLPSIMAQHLFTNFIWSISEHLPKNCLHQGESNARDFVQLDSTTTFEPANIIAQWDRPNLSHPSLTSVVKEAESVGLGTATEILLCVIPALSFRDMLPNEAILGLMPSVLNGIRQYGWKGMATMYRSLLQVCSDGDSEKKHLGRVVLVETIEFMILASQSHELIDELKQILGLITESYSETLKQLAWGFHLQNRRHKIHELFSLCGFRDSLAEALSLDGDTVGKQDSSDSPKTFVVKHPASGWERTDTEQLDIFGWSPIHYVAAGTTRLGPLHSISFSRAIEKGMAYSCLEKSHRTPFHVAASSGNVGFLKTCLRCADTEALKATLCTGGLDGRTPLHLAVEGRHQECVELLLKHLAHCQGDIWGRTPMHLTAIGRSYAIGRELLVHFSEPLQVDKLGNTPLTYLLRNENDTRVDQGRTEFARELMETWTIAKVDDGSGNSLLHYAAAFSDEDVVETLVQELGNVNIPNRQDQTPLHLASLEGRTAVVRKLISLGAQVGSLDDRGWNVLHYAAACRGVELDLVSSILEVKKDIMNTSTTDNSHRTPLHMAAAAGNALVAMLLVSKGAHLNSHDEGGDTPLQLALKNDLKETIDILISCYEALDSWKATDRDAFRHVDLAVRRCTTECLSIVLLHVATTIPMRIHGLKVMVTDRRWKSEDAKLFDLIFNSIPQQQLSILDLNVLVRVSPTAKSSEAIRQAWHFKRRNLAALREDPWALHFLAQHGDTAAVTELLDAGADPSYLDEDNWMPSEVADRYGQTAVRDLLREHLAKSDTERHDRLPHRVPRVIRDIYQDPDVIIKESKSGLQGSYNIRATLGNPEFPCAIFRTQECIPLNVEQYYFEVSVLGDPGHCKFFIGFCSADMPRDKLPGQHPGSWSYGLPNRTLTAWALGEEDASCQAIKSGRPFNHVGCGLNMLTGKGFVTLNGELTSPGTVFDKHKFTKGKIYPCVAFSTHRLRGRSVAYIHFSGRRER